MRDAKLVPLGKAVSLGTALCLHADKSFVPKLNYLAILEKWYYACGTPLGQRGEPPPRFAS